MLTYTCANCQRELEIDDALAGQRIRCPHCDNVEIARSGSRPASAKPATRAAVAEKAATPAPTAPEQTLLVVHPATLRARPVRGAILLLLAAAGVALGVAAYASPGFASYRWAVWAGVAILVAAAIWFAVWKFHNMATTVTITDRRTTVKRGLFSRAMKELRHDQVQDIQITQTFPQRVLNVGRLGLDGGGTDDVEIVVDDLPNPMKLRELVDRYRKH